MIPIILGLASFVVFLLGVLTGNGYITRGQDIRDRRQAAVQRDLNDQARALREKRRVGYEITNETPRRARRRDSHL